MNRCGVRMIHACNCSRLAFKAFAQFGAVCKMSGKNFNADNSIQAGITGFVHLAHSARTNGGEAVSRERTDLPAQKQSRSASDAGWPSLAAIPAAMDRGTHQRLAGKLPALGCPLRPFAHNLRCVHSYRLLHDRLTGGCTIAPS
jgi:hypothetical protein